MIYVIAAVAASAAALYLSGMRRCVKDPVFAAPARVLFLLLSLTWGLPMTLAGAFAAFFLLITGHKPGIFGRCVLFKLSRAKFGLSLGLFIFAPEGDMPTASHEHGHSVQNVYFGPFTPLCVGIPSAVRFWYRKFRSAVKKPCRTAYDHIWFERSATESGLALYSKPKKEISR